MTSISVEVGGCEDDPPDVAVSLSDAFEGLCVEAPGADPFVSTDSSQALGGRPGCTRRAIDHAYESRSARVTAYERLRRRKNHVTFRIGPEVALPRGCLDTTRYEGRPSSWQSTTWARRT